MFAPTGHFDDLSADDSLLLERVVQRIVRPRCRSRAFHLPPHDPVDGGQRLAIRMAFRERRRHRWQIVSPI